MLRTIVNAMKHGKKIVIELQQNSTCAAHPLKNAENCHVHKITQVNVIVLDSKDRQMKPEDLFPFMSKGVRMPRDIASEGEGKAALQYHCFRFTPLELVSAGSHLTPESLETAFNWQIEM
ncbi:hypothetical protein NDU88_012370 [Pleurodeles waltl]|uniref:Uncharacterized protein n=1 Tax=Pleurodeles waltl TaxID=8319 RepID=A0AAV7R5R2_PLEWA|nr:hypothetical protein NDU88_012370 [Pleurodeles waltl]